MVTSTAVVVCELVTVVVSVVVGVSWIVLVVGKLVVVIMAEVAEVGAVVVVGEKDSVVSEERTQGRRNVKQ